MNNSEINTITKLPLSVHTALMKERVKLHRGMTQSGFQIQKSKMFSYGCSVHFIYKGNEDWFIMYKNKKSRTTFCFNFIIPNLTIAVILGKINLKKIAEGDFRKTLSCYKSRKKIRWHLKKRYRNS